MTATYCKTCGGELTRDWAGWMHKRQPTRRHVVKPDLTPAWNADNVLRVLAGC